MVQIQDFSLWGLGPLSKCVNLVLMLGKLWGKKQIIKSCLPSGFSGSRSLYCKRAFVRWSRRPAKFFVCFVLVVVEGIVYEPLECLWRSENSIQESVLSVHQWESQG